MSKAYMDNGTIVAHSEEELRAYLFSKYSESLEFQVYVQEHVDKATFNSTELDAYSVLRKFPQAYKRELEYFVDAIVMNDLEGYGIIDMDYVPVNEREFMVTPANEPWKITGADAANYYENFADLDVGEEHRTSAYTIVRTRNAKPHAKRRGIFNFRRR